MIPRFRRLTHARETHIYETVSPIDEKKFKALSHLFEVKDLQVIDWTVSKKATQMTCVWRVYGAPEQHDHMMHELLTDPDLEEVEVN
jgi:succinate dehydrogenase flavin-adding protein (antitoxin of CptAB toxin-antitoxin module)